MDLFEQHRRQKLAQEGPLPARMRPRNLDEVTGHEQLVGTENEPGPLRLLVRQSKRPPSLLLYGPPGCGKTSLALALAAETEAHFTNLNATAATVTELRDLMHEAKNRLGQTGRYTLLFIDEIHRLQRTQQDVLLPALEDGSISLVGATTENPHYTMQGPLLSRLRIYQLDPLDVTSIVRLLERALQDDERGLGQRRFHASPRLLENIAVRSNGDARFALSALEAMAQIAQARNETELTEEQMELALPRGALAYDRQGDRHYDTISAWIKSIRGSDPDAAIYWLARMLEGGEDPMFIGRRLMIVAAEDIGLADPSALPLAVAAVQAVQMIGLPEGRIPLAEATIYCALAPKSNAAYLAIGRAQQAVRQGEAPPVPMHLRDASHSGSKKMGYGKDYIYPHDDPRHWVPQNYLPEGLTRTRFYEPGCLGAEQALVARWLQRTQAPAFDQRRQRKTQEIPDDPS